MSKGISYRRQSMPDRPFRLSDLVPGTAPHQLSFLTLSVLLGLCVLGGGSSFLDTSSLLYLRPASVVAIAIFVLLPGRLNIAPFKVPLILLGCLAGIMLLQLVPLPPDVWLSLPGRERYGEAAAAAGLEQPWRPLTLTPDLTWNSLAGLVVPAAVLIGFARLELRQRQSIMVVFVAICCASAVMGVLQLAYGGNSLLYLYRHTHPGMPVGFLANRNHQAALLALSFPLLRVWLATSAATRRSWQAQPVIALAIAILMLPLILATGSRAGAVLAVLGLASVLIVLPRGDLPGEGRSDRRKSRLLIAGVAVVAIGLAVVTVRYGRALSIDRLVSGTEAVDEDLRFNFFPQALQIARDFFPFGTGFGSFEPVFMNFEPDATLIDRIPNQAHNDLIDLLMTTGLPGLCLLLAFLTWVAARGFACFFGSLRRSRSAPIGRLGFVIVMLLLLASLVDYPLRTPLMGALFAVGCAWLCERAGAGEGKEERGRAEQSVALLRPLG